jgi:hypothetical protein
VRGISEDKKSVETTAYVGSLVGATRAIVLATLSRSDYVRVKIAIKSECKIPEVAKGAILPYLYDFYYEREMEVVPNAEEVAMEDTSGQGEKKSADDYHLVECRRVDMNRLMNQCLRGERGTI